MKRIRTVLLYALALSMVFAFIGFVPHLFSHAHAEKTALVNRDTAVTGQVSAVTAQPEVVKTVVKSETPIDTSSHRNRMIFYIFTALGTGLIGMSFARTHNIGAFIASVRTSDNASLTAGGAGDNTQVVGQIIDRTLFSFPQSATFAIFAKAVLGASATLTLKTVLIEHGDAANLSDAATFSAPADFILFTDAGAGSTLRGQKEYDIDLAGAKRYLRLKFTPDLSAANTDTAECSSVVIFGGTDTVPV
jgi:hypothetical protein